MKSLIELVEDFIEALFVGDVMTGLHDKDYIMIMRQERPQFVSEYTQMMDELTTRIQAFIITDREADKKAFAQDIFNNVLMLRNVGFIINNPNSIKEVSFYRARALYFEDRNKELTETVMALKAGQSAVR